MTKHEIDAHRGRSKAKNKGPWETDYEEMAKKTVFRSVFKWLPIVVEALEAEAVDGASVKYNAQTGVVETDRDLEIDYTIDREAVTDAD
jgi:recombinational DNA repair protein RecT